MSDIDRALTIATKAHAGQFDKAGKPYILHPLRIMLKFTSDQEMIVALLHDVIEDSSFTLDYLSNFGFSVEILDALDCLTKRDNEAYEDFIARILQNELARKVKIEDLKDNLDTTRLHKITEKDLIRIQKYHSAFNLLLKQTT